MKLNFIELKLNFIELKLNFIELKLNFIELKLNFIELKLKLDLEYCYIWLAILQAGIELICEFPKQCLIITKTCFDSFCLFGEFAKVFERQV